VRCSGFVSKADDDRLLVPTVEQVLKASERIRLYHEVAPDFAVISPGDHGRAALKEPPR
jgi:hypothetical protein